MIKLADALAASALAIGMMSTLGGTAQAASAGPESARVVVDETRNQIAVVGQGAISAAPDIMRLSVGVEVRRATAGEAFKAARSASATLTRALVRAGVSADDLTTNELSLGPEYESYPKVTGYRGAQGVDAIVRDLSKADKIIDAAAAVGNEVRLNGITFEVSNPGRQLEAARAAAFKDAGVKAKQYAALAGRQLGEVLEISEEVTGGPTPVHLTGALVEDKASVSPGRQTLGVNVRVVYRLR
ncbi:SIMPL domain-containing protein [Nonomuraea sp. NPDC059194]|uniref:SIMPL domain-containing protein n=1 Tax=Nonomuraea sp. NPDC059194 TaxID=3346764 RepID=UPI00369EDAFE